MIMPRGSDQLLLPVNPLFIAFTLLMAFAVNLLPLGRQPGMPDLLIVALAFWNVHQGALLGQHALAYTGLSFVAITVHRRLLWFGVVEQAVQILPLFFAVHGLSLAVRMLAGGMFPGWWLLLAPVLEALLWPLATLLLLAPQRRAPDPDQNRPL